MGKVELGVGDILIVPDGTCTSCLKLLTSLFIVDFDVNAKFSGREGSAPANDFIPLSPMRSSSFGVTFSWAPVSASFPCA